MHYVNKHFNIFWKILLNLTFAIDDLIVDILHIVRREPLI